MKKLLLVSFLIIAMLGIANASQSRLRGLNTPAWATPDDWECIYLSPAFATRLEKSMIIFDLNLNVQSKEFHIEDSRQRCSGDYWDVSQEVPWPGGTQMTQSGVVAKKEYLESEDGTTTLTPLLGYINAGGDMAFGIYFKPKIKSRERTIKAEVNDANTTIEWDCTETWDYSSMLNFGALFAMKMGTMDLGIGVNISGEGMEGGGDMDSVVYEKEVITDGTVEPADADKEERSFMLIAPQVGLNLGMGDSLLGFVVGIGLISGTDEEDYLAGLAPGDRYRGKLDISGMNIEISVLPELKMGADQMLKAIAKVEIGSLDKKYVFQGLATDIGYKNKGDTEEMSSFELTVGGALNSKLTKDCKSILGLSLESSSAEITGIDLPDTTVPTAFTTTVMNFSELAVKLFLGLENDFSESIIGRVGIGCDVINSESQATVTTPSIPAIATRDDENSDSTVLGNWIWSAGLTVLPAENVSIDGAFSAKPVSFGFGSKVDYKDNIAPGYQSENTSSSTEINVSLAVTVKL